MIKYFAVSDVHSYFYPLLNALQRNGFETENSNHKLVICGDLFDRGPDAIKCYNFIDDLIDKDRLIYVRGNHEDLMLDCLSQIRKSSLQSHHFHNGTVDTVAQFLNVSAYDVVNNCYNSNKFDEVENKLRNLILNCTVDFFELPQTIFVHGWVPTVPHDTTDEEVVHTNWRDGDWKAARWLNGMQMHHFGVVPEKQVVCGHFHTSYGHAKIDGICSEFGHDAIFKPFIKDGIIAIDACTAYTNMINCVVFDEHGNQERGNN